MSENNESTAVAFSYAFAEVDYIQDIAALQDSFIVCKGNHKRTKKICYMNLILSKMTGWLALFYINQVPKNIMTSRDCKNGESVGALIRNMMTCA